MIFEPCGLFAPVPLTQRYRYQIFNANEGSFTMRKQIVFGALIAALFILAACGSSPSYSSNTPSPNPPNDPWSDVVLTGETEPMLEGTIWADIDDADDILEFRADGRLINRRIITIKNTDGSVWNTVPASANGTWQYDGNIVKFVIHTSYYNIPGTSYRVYLYPSYMEGKYYPQTNRIMGTAKTNSGGEYDFTLIPSTGSAQSMAQRAAPAPQVAVQPSAPAQTAPAAPAAPARPTLQGGLYAYTKTNIVMSINLTAYQVTAYVGNKPIGFGSCRISGDQLVLTFRSGFDEGAALQGNTYAYTITSSTSFSGSGEEWVYRGGIIVPSLR